MVVIGIIANATELLNPPELVGFKGFRKGNISGITATYFIPNKRLLPKDVLYSSTNGYIKILKDGTILLGNISLHLVGSRPHKIVPENREGKFAYFGPNKSVSKVPMYKSIRYINAYKGIDLVINGLRGGKFEYYFYIKPGASPNKIAFEIKGGKIDIYDREIRIKRGDEVIVIGEIKAFQGAKEINVSFKKLTENTIGFEVIGYNPEYPLVIDPTAVFASPLFDVVSDIAVADNGEIYITGFTRDYINFAGGYDRLHGTAIMDSLSVFVSKLSPDMSTLISNVIISGSSLDYGWQIILANDGTLYVGVSTRSWDFAPFRYIYGTISTQNYDVAITRLDTSLMTHLATAIVAGTHIDLFRGMTIASDGTLYITGYTYDSQYFAPSRVVHGNRGLIDAFVVHLSHDLATHFNTAIVSGSSDDGAFGVATDSTGVYVVGTTNSSDFAPSRTIWGVSGGWKAFITKLSLDLSTHLNTVMVSGSGDEIFYKPEIDNLGNILVMGRTTNPTNLSQSRTIWGTPGYQDVFITKATPDLSTHLATTVIAAPDSAWIRYRSFTIRGDTAFVYIAVTNPSAWGGTYCSPCNYAPGGGPADGIIFGVSVDLTTCIGKSVITGAGADDAFSIKVKGNNIYTAGAVSTFDTAWASTYPQPLYIYGYPFDADGLIISVRPSCLVGVSESADNYKGEEIRIFSDRIIINLSKPSYVGYDIYLPNGRMLENISVGYLHPGKHVLPLRIPAKGVFFIHLRLGDEVRNIKVIRR